MRTHKLQVPVRIRRPLHPNGFLKLEGSGRMSIGKSGKKFKVEVALEMSETLSYTDISEYTPATE